MKISAAIETLQQIQKRFGDISITGGSLMDDKPLTDICVTDVEGMKVWPVDPNGVLGDNEIDGVFLS